MTRNNTKLLAAAAALLGLFLVLGVLLCLKVDQVTVNGNVYYSQEEIEEKVFAGRFGRSPLVLWLNRITGRQRQVPFLQKYTLEMKGLTEAEITVYEKNLVGYVRFMDNCLYFDRDGYVLESTRDRIADIPEITGLDLDSVVLNRKLPLEDDRLLDLLLSIVLYLSDEEIAWNEAQCSMVSLTERIHIDARNRVFCMLGDVTVSLGTEENMEGKLHEMRDILPSLCGRKGTLHLENYDPAATGHSYLFQ